MRVSGMSWSPGHLEERREDSGTRRSGAPRLSSRREASSSGLVAVVYAVSLALLVHYLVVGGTHTHVEARRLILSGVVLWVTNVMLFAVWYWELDRGGPVTRFQNPDTGPDFLYPQMDSDAAR